MFVRVKPAGAYRYLQIAQNYREGKKVKQKVLCTLGRVDELTQSGGYFQLLWMRKSMSSGKFSMQHPLPKSRPQISSLTTPWE